MEQILKGVKCERCNGVFHNGDLYFAVSNGYSFGSDRIYCERCVRKVGEFERSRPYLVYEGQDIRVLDKKTIEYLGDALFAVRMHYGHWVVTHTYSHEYTLEERLSWIENKLAKHFFVLEKNENGVVVRFPNTMSNTERSSFSLNDKPFSDWYEMLFRSVRATSVSVLFRGDRAIGIAKIAGIKNALHEYATCNGGYEIINETYFKERTSKRSPIADRVAERLAIIKPSDMLKYFEKRLVGQGDETKKIVYTFYDYFAHIASGAPFTAQNWLLTAPSGCGKTEVYRILRDFCREYGIPVPVEQIDLSKYTEAGYRGDDIEFMIHDIMVRYPKNEGIAVCFLDETDKKCLPSYTSKGDNVNAAVQSNLLTLVEGRVVTKDKNTFDTNKTMFVFMGSFQDIRDERQKSKEKQIGFGMQHDTNGCSDNAADCFYGDITIEEIIEYGMLEELAGRLTQIINLHRLSEKDMRLLLEEKAKSISKELQIPIELKKTAYRSLLDISYTNLGIRRPMNCIRTLATNTLAKLYFDDEFDKSEHKIVIRSADKANIAKLYNDNTDTFT